MNKVRRVERMVAMTKLLVDSPQKLISLNYFCDFFGMAKSTVSEDLTCVRQSMEHFQLGTLETVAGVAGGVRFIPHRKGEQANEILRDVQQRLREPDRIIPGGFIYMSDILLACDDSVRRNYYDSLCGSQSRLYFDGRNKRDSFGGYGG